MNLIEWRKSSRSGNNGACVEVARLDENMVGIRDSKDRGRGAELHVSVETWRRFLEATAEGRFDC